MKEIFFIRHAKSSWENSALADFDRPLNERGRIAAPDMGQRLFAKGIEPDRIVSSSAKRAISTARLVADEFVNKIEIIEESKLYHASTFSILDVVNQISNSLSRIFLVGHNPGFSDVVEYLSDASLGNLPTTAAVGIRFHFDSWSLISGSTGELIFYDYPKNKP